MQNNNIILIFLVLIVTYLLYQVSCLKKSLKENMSNTSNIDYEAIKNLGVIAKGLTKGGFTIPGNVKINGNLTVTKNSNSKSVTTGSVKSNSLNATSINGSSLSIAGNSDFCTSSGRKIRLGVSAYKNETSWIGFYSNNNKIRRYYLMGKNNGNRRGKAFG